MSTENIIFTGVAIYMLGMLGVGFYASRKSQTVTDFMVAGRGLSLPILSMTVLATWFGGAMMLGGAGAAFDGGMLGVIADPWGGALALVLVGLFFARLFRKLKIITVTDFMETITRSGLVGLITTTKTGLLSGFGAPALWRLFAQIWAFCPSPVKHVTAPSSPGREQLLRLSRRSLAAFSGIGTILH